MLFCGKFIVLFLTSISIVDKIPVPITFNTYKHHFRFLKWKIEEWKKQEWKIVEKELLTLGENLLDFYLGELAVKEICEEVTSYFKHKNISDLEAFKLWLRSAEYRKIELSDHSHWVIKEGINPQRYIHIHPAKYSDHTLRIRAVTLKTVCTLQIKSVVIHKSMRENLEQVNYIRKNYLNLSPIKSLSYNEGIFKIWRMFEDY